LEERALEWRHDLAKGLARLHDELLGDEQDGIRKIGVQAGSGKRHAVLEEVIEMATEQEISDAGTKLKRAAAALEQAARAASWEDAKRHINEAAAQLRRAGNELE
jgi:hypothetical protein